MIFSALAVRCLLSSDVYSRAHGVIYVCCKINLQLCHVVQIMYHSFFFHIRNSWPMTYHVCEGSEKIKFCLLTYLKVLYSFLESNLHYIVYSLQCPEKSQDDFKLPGLPEYEWTCPKLRMELSPNKLRT